jgi:hypothetical protein
LQIIAPPLAADQVTVEEYYDWIEEVFLRQIRDYQPAVFAWIVQRSKELVEIGAREAIQRYEARKGKL